MNTTDINNKFRTELLQHAAALLALNQDKIVINNDVILEYGGNTYDENSVSLMMGPHHIHRIEKTKDGAVFVFSTEDAPRGTDFSYYSLPEMMNILSAMEQHSEKEAKQEYFPITSVSRDDLASRGFNISDVDDTTMEKLTSFEYAMLRYLQEGANAKDDKEIIGITKEHSGKLLTVAQKDFTIRAVEWLRKNAGKYWYDDMSVPCPDDFIEDFLKEFDLS